MMPLPCRFTFKSILFDVLWQKYIRDLKKKFKTPKHSIFNYADFFTGFQALIKWTAKFVATKAVPFPGFYCMLYCYCTCFFTHILKNWPLMCKDGKQDAHSHLNIMINTSEYNHYVKFVTFLWTMHLCDQENFSACVQDVYT